MKQREGNTEYLVPSTLGIGLIEGYNSIGIENSLSKPILRRLVSVVISYFHHNARPMLTQYCHSIDGTSNATDL